MIICILVGFESIIFLVLLVHVVVVIVIVFILALLLLLEFGILIAVMTDLVCANQARGRHSDRGSCRMDLVTSRCTTRRISTGTKFSTRRARCWTASGSFKRSTAHSSRSRPLSKPSP